MSLVIALAPLVRINFESGYKFVPCLAHYGDLAVTSRVGYETGYVITHVASGSTIGSGSYNSVSQAREAAKCFAQFDWSAWKNYDALNHATTTPPADVCKKRLTELKQTGYYR